MGSSPFFFSRDKMLNRGLDKLELLRIVEAVANEKSIDKELVIGSMESAIQKAALTKFGNDNNIEVEVAVLREELNVDGEGGEYETLVVYGPHFSGSIKIEGEKQWFGRRGHYKINKISNSFDGFSS